MWCNSLTLHFPTEPFKMLSTSNGANRCKTGILSGTEMKLFDSVTFILMFSYLHQPRLWLPPLFKHRSVLYEEEYKNSIMPVSSWTSSGSLDFCQHYITCIFCSHLLQLEEFWRNLNLKSVLRDLPDEDIRGSMQNCRVFLLKVCSSLSSCYFWHDGAPGATCKCIFKKKDTITQTSGFVVMCAWT